MFGRVEKEERRESWRGGEWSEWIRRRGEKKKMGEKKREEKIRRKKIKYKEG